MRASEPTSRTNRPRKRDRPDHWRVGDRSRLVELILWFGGMPMIEKPAISPRRGSSWMRWVPRVLVALFLAFFGAGGALIYYAASVSIQAENTLHVTQFAIRLVDGFVSERGRWPRSWGELEGVSMREGPFGQEWPAASPEVQRRVSIDFSIDPRDVAGQDPMSFTAIRPIGPHFEYRHYGVVESLQETIRKSRIGAVAK